MDPLSANPEPNAAAAPAETAEPAAEEMPAPRFGGRSPPRARVGRSPPRVRREGPGPERPASRITNTDMGLKYGSYVPTQREIDSGEVVVQEVVAVKKQDHVETEALQLGEGEGNDWEAATKEVTDNMFSKDWNVRFDTLRALRILVKFQPVALTQIISDVGKCLQECLKNPRSAILREVCMLTADLLSSTALMDAVCAELTFDKLIPALLLKSINDKKFIRDAAQHALDTHSNAAAHMFHVYLACLEGRNHKICGSAANTVHNCIKNLSEIPEELFGDVTVRLVKVCLHGKLAGTRKHGQSCLELMEQMPSSTPLDTRLDALCTTKDRAAIQKLLHPSEADLSPRSRNQTLKEAIAKSPTHSARVSNNTDILDDLESLNAHPFVCGDVVLEKGAAPAAPAQVAQDVTASKSEEEIISSF